MSINRKIEYIGDPQRVPFLQRKRNAKFDVLSVFYIRMGKYMLLPENAIQRKIDTLNDVLKVWIHSGKKKKGKEPTCCKLSDYS